MSYLNSKHIGESCTFLAFHKNNSRTWFIHLKYVCSFSVRCLQCSFTTLFKSEFSYLEYKVACTIFVATHMFTDFKIYVCTQTLLGYNFIFIIQNVTGVIVKINHRCCTLLSRTFSTFNDIFGEFIIYS